MNTYTVTIANTNYNAANGINAKIGDKVAYEWNPNNKIDTVLRIENGEIVTDLGRGDAAKFHLILS